MLVIQDQTGLLGEMKLNDFNVDLEYSLEAGEDTMFDNFYWRIFGSVLQSIEKVTDKDLQLKGVDKILILKNGKKIMIDEKKRRKDYDDIAIEIWSDTAKNTPGWVFKPFTDYVVYAFMPSKRVYLLPSLLLKIYVHENWENLVNFFQPKAVNHGYITTSVAVPIDILLEGLKQIMTQNLWNKSPQKA